MYRYSRLSAFVVVMMGTVGVFWQSIVLAGEVKDMCVADMIGKKAEMLGMVIGVVVGIDWEM